MKLGTEYEKFVELVYLALSLEKNYTYTIERNKRIIGTSGASHEIDVYWEFQHQGKIFKIAIECKDLNRKISKGRVTEFFGKLHDIPSIDGGIMATKIGYQIGAKKFAKQYNIETYLVKQPDVSDFKTNTVLKIEILLNIIHSDIRNVKPIIDMEWMKQNYKSGTVFQLQRDGYTFFISDQANGFYGTLNEYINLSSINQNVIQDIDHEKVQIIVDGFLIDSITNTKFKIAGINYDRYIFEETSTITIDGLELADAIIKDVQNGIILFIKKK